MTESTQPSRTSKAAAGDRPSASLLVRCWIEPQQTGGQAPVLRGYVKNLKTGEETFIKDLDSIGDQILRTLQPAAAAAIAGDDVSNARAEKG